MNPRSVRRRTVGAVTSVVTALGVLSLGASNAAATERSTAGEDQQAQADGAVVGFGGHALGSQAWTSDGSIRHGPLGWATLNCVQETGLEKTANTASSDLGDLGSLGVTDSSVRTVDDDGWKKTVSTTATGSATLLSGLIKAEGLSATSIAATDGKDYVGSNRSRIASLTIAGRPIDVEAGPNTTIDLALPGVGSIGKVVLNKQFKGWSDGEYKVHTEALHVRILADNPLGLKIGTVARVGVSNARLTKPTPALLTGFGYATKAQVGGKVLEHGPTAYAPVPCDGGKAESRLGRVRLGKLATAAAAETRASGTTGMGDRADGAATSRVVDTIGDLNVLDGLITAKAVTANATADTGATPIARLIGAGLGKNGGSLASTVPVRLSDAGTGFVDLRIAGHPVITDNVAPNTTLRIAGVGTVTLRKTERVSRRISITMIEIELGRATRGLPAGAVVQIGHAQAGLR